jgi:hypothetical protein
MPGKTFGVQEINGVAVGRFDNGSAGAGTTTLDLEKGCYQKQTCSASTRTIAAPVYGSSPVLGNANVPAGTLLFVEVSNTSGGALTVTWNAIFKGAPANPATATRLISLWVWDGTNWVLVNEGVTDVPN